MTRAFASSSSVSHVFGLRVLFQRCSVRPEREPLVVVLSREGLNGMGGEIVGGGLTEIVAR